jgi:translation elongation factor EF-1beta
MKAGEIRRLSLDYTVAQLEEAVESIVEHEKDLIQVDGEDIGERLTNLNLALRVRQRVEQSGEEHKHAFRSVMGSVRDLLSNDE